MNQDNQVDYDSGSEITNYTLQLRSYVFDQQSSAKGIGKIVKIKKKL